MDPLICFGHRQPFCVGLNDVVDSDDRDQRVAYVHQRRGAYTVIPVICGTSSEENGGGGSTWYPSILLGRSKVQTALGLTRIRPGAP